ncbi:hypothetical protein KJ680_01785 [bacterium]|nr:hypothetical protein [bacterium]
MFKHGALKCTLRQSLRLIYHREACNFYCVVSLPKCIIKSFGGISAKKDKMRD